MSKIVQFPTDFHRGYSLKNFKNSSISTDFHRGYPLKNVKNQRFFSGALLGAPCAGEIGFSLKIPVLGIFKNSRTGRDRIFLKNPFWENNIHVVGSVLCCVET